MYRINVYIPASHLEVVKIAIFNAGAGRIGNYDQCCWQIKGQGQFRPLTGSDAFIGQQDKLETVGEYKVELVCGSEVLNDVIAAMKQAHPYEEPAYDVYQPVQV
jgi:hypothetical protein